MKHITEDPQFLTPEASPEGLTCLLCAACGVCGGTVAALKMAIHGVSIWDGTEPV